jgi:hypothetical protein
MRLSHQKQIMLILGLSLAIHLSSLSDTQAKPQQSVTDAVTQDRVLLVENGTETWITQAEALNRGYEIVDLFDSWVPIIFENYENAKGEILEPPYKDIFIGLANDLEDGDGEPLPDGEKNYLEVFGIPPTLGVLWDRYQLASTQTCFQEIDYEKIKSLTSIPFPDEGSAIKLNKKIEKAKLKIEEAMAQTGATDYNDLIAKKPAMQADVELLQKKDKEAEVVLEIEKNLNCTGLIQPNYKHQPGKLDEGLRMALRRFQRKHKLYEYANLRSKTMALLGTPHDELLYLDLRRVMEERVIAATQILEDGTGSDGDKPATYKGKDGNTYEVRNLVQEFTDAAMQQIGLADAAQAKAFFSRRTKADFEWLRVAVKFPPRPEYYSAHMEMNVIVDRGDVWYDPPFDGKGKKIQQARQKLPKFTLYTTYLGQKIKLIHWPTTIGGWRTEIAPNGHTYYKYKKSDVGERIIRNVISGPVWLPPETTPLKGLTKRRYVNGKVQTVVNYEEMGPGYLSAYGLVAGYFISRVGGDNGIRAHGSSDYMSILSSGFSHGCHRLMNHHAVRLYGYILSHRNRVVKGDQIIKHERQFLFKDQVYQIRVPSRGFLFELTPPIDVNVLEGRIKGKYKAPIEGYVKMPNRKYPDGDPSLTPAQEEALKQQEGTQPTTPAPDSAPEAIEQ